MPGKNLYKQKIIDHYKNPRNQGDLKEFDYRIQISNAVCGDEVTVFLKTDDGKISEVAHQGSGCAISMAGASILSENIIGMSIKDVMELKPEYVLELLGMDKKSSRIKCALLGLEAFQKAINMEEDDPCDFC